MSKNSFDVEDDEAKEVLEVDATVAVVVDLEEVLGGGEVLRKGGLKKNLREIRWKELETSVVAESDVYGVDLADVVLCEDAFG